MDREAIAKAIHEASWPQTIIDLTQTIIDLMNGTDRKPWERVKTGDTMGDTQAVVEAYGRADAVLALLERLDSAQ